jgi:CheY-like chemotaxis protein
VSRKSPISFKTGTKNILIIDGNEAMQKLRANVLRAHGVHVYAAKSVTEAESLWVPDFFDLCWTHARDPKKQWRSGEGFGASIQGSGSAS